MSINVRRSFFVLMLLGLATAGFPAAAEVVLTDSETKDPAKAEPAPGSLVLPAREKDGAADNREKCMTVCARWGEECTYINRGAGGTTRKCRRACKQFTEECF